MRSAMPISWPISMAAFLRSLSYALLTAGNLGPNLDRKNILIVIKIHGKWASAYPEVHRRNIIKLESKEDAKDSQIAKSVNKFVKFSQSYLKLYMLWWVVCVKISGMC